MAEQPGIPELQFNHPDGRPRYRLEMDQWLRTDIPKVHWLRIIANRSFGLPKTIAWDMREIVLRHWLLDEMVRRQHIVGDQLGVNAQQPNDEGELRQFVQRLTALIQSGQAVQPQQAEGVDMSFTPPPPPVIGGAPNGQPQQAYPQGPPQPPPQPPGPPAGFAPPQPPGPPPGPPQGYQQQPPGPPGPPMGPPGGYQQQAAPPAPPPMGAPQMGPPMSPPPGPPAPGGAPAPSQGRRGRGAAKSEAAPPAAPVPPMAGPPASAPQGFAPAPFPQQNFPTNTAATPLPQGQSFQVPTAAPAVDLSGVYQKIDQVLAQNAALAKQIEYLSTVITVLGRGMYQKPGSADVVGFLKELGIIPQ